MVQTLSTSSAVCGSCDGTAWSASFNDFGPVPTQTPSVHAGQSRGSHSMSASGKSGASSNVAKPSPAGVVSVIRSGMGSSLLGASYGAWWDGFQGAGRLL